MPNSLRRNPKYIYVVTYEQTLFYKGLFAKTVDYHYGTMLNLERKMKKIRDLRMEF